MSESLDLLETLVDRWLPLPDLADALGVPVARIRRLVDEGELLAVRRGTPKVLSVPADLAVPEPLPGLAGTVTVLRDAGYDDTEALVWLFSPLESLAATPVAAMRSGRKTEIRRQAQLLAF